MAIILPRKIYLTATGQHWRIRYIHKPGKITLLELPYYKLAVYGKNYSKRAAIKLISKWIKMKSKLYLTAQLLKINRKMKAKYTKVIIHSLKTEWGSCTAKKEVGLHYKLIFLPPRIVKYVIVHELCHLKRLDHSPKFWKEVAKYDKNWQKNKIAVDDADEHVPDWLIF